MKLQPLELVEVSPEAGQRSCKAGNVARVSYELCLARLMFDYPSPGAIAKYAAAQLAPSSAPAAPVIRAVADTRGPLAALSTACHFPADGDDVRTFWAALVSKTDGVTEIPYERWDVDEYFDPSPNTVGRMYVRHAAFVKNAECFDAALFAISGAEAWQ